MCHCFISSACVAAFYWSFKCIAVLLSLRRYAIHLLLSIILVVFVRSMAVVASLAMVICCINIIIIISIRCLFAGALTGSHTKHTAFRVSIWLIFSIIYALLSFLMNGGRIGSLQRGATQSCAICAARTGLICYN
jgi:hypothetical protein